MTSAPTRPDPPPRDDPLETISEVAAHARLHPKTVYRWLKTGQGPDEIVRLNGRNIAVRRSVRERWINSRTKKTAAGE